MKNTIFLDLTPFIAEKFIEVSEDPTFYIIRIKEKARQPEILLFALWLYTVLPFFLLESEVVDNDLLRNVGNFLSECTPSHLKIW